MISCNWMASPILMDQRDFLLMRWWPMARKLEDSSMTTLADTRCDRKMWKRQLKCLHCVTVTMWCDDSNSPNVLNDCGDRCTRKHEHFIDFMRCSSGCISVFSFVRSTRTKETYQFTEIEENKCDWMERTRCTATRISLRTMHCGHADSLFSVRTIQPRSWMCLAGDQTDLYLLFLFENKMQCVRVCAVCVLHSNVSHITNHLTFISICSVFVVALVACAWYKFQCFFFFTFSFHQNMIISLLFFIYFPFVSFVCHGSWLTSHDHVYWRRICRCDRTAWYHCWLFSFPLSHSFPLSVASHDFVFAWMIDKYKMKNECRLRKMHRNAAASAAGKKRNMSRWCSPQQ